MSARWSWADVWPGSKVITLVLDPFEAEEFLDQARAEGRLVGRNVVRGLPGIAMADPIGDGEAADIEEPSKEPQGTVEAAPEAPAANVVILPVVRREPLPEPARPTKPALPAAQARGISKAPAPSRPIPVTFPAGAFLAERPAGDEPSTVIKTVDPATRAMIDAALAEGRVTKCEARKHALDANAPAAAAWKRSGPFTAAGKAARARAQAKARAKDKTDGPG